MAAMKRRSRAAVKPAISSSRVIGYRYDWACSDCDPPVQSRSYSDYQEAKRERDAHNADCHPERLDPEWVPAMHDSLGEHDA